MTHTATIKHQHDGSFFLFRGADSVVTVRRVMNGIWSSQMREAMQRTGRDKVPDQPGAVAPMNESEDCPCWIRREPDGSVTFWEIV